MPDHTQFPCTSTGCMNTVAWAGRGRHPKFCDDHRTYRARPAAPAALVSRTCIECGSAYVAASRETCGEKCRHRVQWQQRAAAIPKLEYYCQSCDSRAPLAWSGKGRHPTRCEDCKAANTRRTSATRRHRLASGACSVPDCAGGLEARGLCRRHYKQTRPRTPDKPRLVRCVVCDTEVLRSPVSPNARRYGHTCSHACAVALVKRDVCELPPEHWARMWGATCSVNVRTCARCDKPMTSQHAARMYCNQACASPSTAQRREDKACECCGEQFAPASRAHRWCSPRCTRKGSKQIRRAREYAAQGTYTTKQVRHLWRLFGEACAYCDTPTSFKEIEAEHVVAISKGGANDITNLLVACRLCNTGKSTFSLTEWAERRAMQGKPPVRITWEAGDARYAHLVIPSPCALAA